MKNLCICTLDLFGAGTETTTTTLHWGLLYMIYYPHIQGGFVHMSTICPTPYFQRDFIVSGVSYRSGLYWESKCGTHHFPLSHPRNSQTHIVSCFYCAERVQAEIDTVIGSSRHPSMTDRENMPYTNAVIHEIQRMADIIPLNLAHMTSKDTMLDKYTIPKVCCACFVCFLSWIFIQGADSK